MWKGEWQAETESGNNRQKVRAKYVCCIVLGECIYLFIYMWSCVYLCVWWIFKMLTWKTVTVAHKMLLKCFRSHSQCGCLLIISGQVHSLSCPLSSSVNLQNFPPNRYMPRMLWIWGSIYILFISFWLLYSWYLCIYL